MSDQPQPPRIPPGMPLTIILQAQQWFGVLQQLTEGPFKIVGPLIGEIERQIMQQTTMQQQPMSAVAPGNPYQQGLAARGVPANGEDPDNARH